MRINVALGITRDWTEYACVTVASVLCNANKNDDYYFYILSSGMTEDDKDHFLNLNLIKKSTFEFIEIDN